MGENGEVKIGEDGKPEVEKVINWALRMKKGRVYDNKEVGINIVGVGSESLIEDVQVDNNRGPGIRIGIGSKIGRE